MTDFLPCSKLYHRIKIGTQSLAFNFEEQLFLKTVTKKRFDKLWV